MSYYLYIKSIDFNAIKVETSFSKKPYSCENCDFTTKYKTVLREHQRREREQNKPESFKCDVPQCSFTTKVRSLFYRHRAKCPSSILRHKVNVSGAKLICSGCKQWVTKRLYKVNEALSAWVPETPLQ